MSVTNQIARLGKLAALAGLLTASCIASAQTITTFAGNGNTAFNGDGIAAVGASLGNPASVAADSLGNIYIADANHFRIRKVGLNGIITTVAGNGSQGFSGDGGAATSASISSPRGIALDSAGNLYFADTGNHRVRKVTPGGVITTVAGTGDPNFSGDGGAATSARLYSPYGTAIDGAGNLLIVDTVNSRIRKVDSNGIITTVVGNGTPTSIGDGGPATDAGMSIPMALALDNAGNLFIAEYNSHRIRKVNTTGTISTVAGNGTAGFSGDGGPATSAGIRFPTGVAVDALGILYISDTNNRRVRRVFPNGMISTLAGNGIQGFSGDNGPAASASLSEPTGLAVDKDRSVYIADEFNNRMRKVAQPAPSANDFTQDGKPDLLWNHPATGATYLWRMNGISLAADTFVAQVDPAWKIQAAGDFNLDGHNDLVLRHTSTGETILWYLANGVYQGNAPLFALPPEWVIQGVADFNRDGSPDFLLRNQASGNAFVWYFNGNTPIGNQFLFNVDPVWKVEALTDINFDGQPDLLFRHQGTGLAFLWNTSFDAGTLAMSASSPPMFSIDPVWEVVHLADWNGDDMPDVLFRNRDTGVVFVWYMNGTTLTTSDYIIQIDPSWEIVPRR